MTINNTSSNHYENLSEKNSSNTATIAVPPFRQKQKQHRTIITIRQELEGIAKRHRRLLALDSTNKKDRKKLLEPRHADSEFHNNYHQHEHDEDDDDENYANEDQHYSTLFHEFARVVCHSKAIPRKELFEAWAMALYVHYYFPPSKHDDYHNCCNEDDDDDDEDDDVDSRCQGKEENNDDNENNRKKIYYGRVADLACGHGLVSWALLLLDRSRKRTAICIDKSIPKSCDIIEQVMINRHSSVVYEHTNNCDDVDVNVNVDGDVEQQEQTKTEIKTTTKKPQKQIKRWHYVEGDIQNVKGDSSTLIVGVHCCGTLSDVILDLAISSNAPLALIPCCHTVKSLPLEQQTDEVIDSILKRNMEENKKNNNNNNSNKNDGQYVLLPTTKTDYIDKYRIQKLIEKGYSVQVEYIPSVITPKNRIIVATPRVPEDVLRDMNYNEDNNNTDRSNSGSDGDGDDDKDSKGNATSYSSNSSKHQQQQQMILPKKKKSKAVFTIQLADTKSARSNIASQLSGRIAARMRKRRHPPNLNLSLILPHPEDALPPKRLNELSNKIATEIQLQTKNLQKKTVATNSKVDADADVDDFIQHKITTHVEYGSNGPYTHSETGTYSRSFRIKYKINDPTGIQPEVTKRQAKELHKEVCRRIPIEFPGITLRQSIRS